LVVAGHGQPFFITAQATINAATIKPTTSQGVDLPSFPYVTPDVASLAAMLIRHEGWIWSFAWSGVNPLGLSGVASTGFCDSAGLGVASLEDFFGDFFGMVTF